MHDSIQLMDRIIIIVHAGYKMMRGMWKRLFLKKVRGLLFVGGHVKITHGNHITCGKTVKFEDYAEIHGLCEDGIVFGDAVTIGRYVMIRPSSYYGKDMGKGLVMGNHSSIGPYGYVGCSGKITIGDNVMMGPKCSLFAENHIFADTQTTIKSQGIEQKGIMIEDDCWIGSNCIILDGVTIGKGSVIGAGTLITRDVEPYSIIMDQRQKIVKSRHPITHIVE